MKKELKVIAVVLAGIIVFLAGFGLGTSKGITIDVKVDGASSSASASASGTVTPAPTPAPSPAPSETNAPAPSESTTAPAPVSDGGDTSKPADSNAGAPSAIPSNPKEVAAKYNEVINALKQQKNVSIKKVGTVNIECTDCSVGILKGAVNSILKGFMKGTDETVSFADGKGTNSAGEEVLLNHYIVPADREAAVTENDVVSATASPEGSGYKMTLTFKSEQASYANGSGTDPISHKTAMDPLNLATLELPMGAEITEASMTYPGATVEATVDGSGNLVKLHLNLPLEGSGTGNLKGMSLSVGLKGVLDDNFEITY